MKQNYVIDANFFISISHTKLDDAWEFLFKSFTTGLFQPYITDLVADEIQTVHIGKAQLTPETLEKLGFQIRTIDPKAIEDLENLVGASRSPQHPDLSLMVLTEELNAQGKPAALVSNDFKIAMSVERHRLGYQVLAPSAFLLALANGVTGTSLRMGLKRLSRAVRSSEIQYVLDRRDLYEAEPKLSWLIENLLVAMQDQPGTQTIKVKLTQDFELDLAPIQRYIRGEKVRKSKLGEFENILPFVEVLKNSQELLTKAHNAVENNRLKNALRLVRQYLGKLKNELQIGSAHIGYLDEIKLRRVFGLELAKYHLLASLLDLSLGNAQAAVERLDDAAFMSLIIRDFQGILHPSLLKGMLYLEEGQTKAAERQFKLCAELAQLYELRAYELQSTFGQAISEFLNRKPKTARKTMGHVSRMVEGRERENTPILEDFGDILNAFGKPEIAIHVYDEALECAVEAQLMPEIERVLAKIKQCHFALGHQIPPISRALNSIIDLANQIQDDRLLDRYQEAYDRLENIEAMFKKPFPYEFRDWTAGDKLPPLLFEPMQLVRVHRLEDEADKDGKVPILLICYHDAFGNLGMYFPEVLKIKGFERLEIQLDRNGKYKLYPSPDIYREKFAIRGVIGAQSKDEVMFRRVLNLRAPTIM